MLFNERNTISFKYTGIYIIFSTSNQLAHIIKLTRLRVVDNSDLGKQAALVGRPAKCIHVYGKNKHSMFKLYHSYYALLIKILRITARTHVSINHSIIYIIFESFEG